MSYKVTDPKDELIFGLISLVGGCIIAISPHFVLEKPLPPTAPPGVDVLGYPVELPQLDLPQFPYGHLKWLKVGAAVAGALACLNGAACFNRFVEWRETLSEEDEASPVAFAVQSQPTNPIEQMQQMMLMGMMARLMPLFEDIGVTPPKTASGELGESSSSSEIPDEAQCLIDALSGLKLRVQWVELVEAPTFIRHIIRPIGGTRINQLTKTGEDLQAALGLPEPPLFETTRKGLAIDLAREERLFCPFQDYSMSSESPTLPIGVDLNGKLVEADLSNPNTCHFLVGGATGGGKSEWMLVTFVSLANRFSPKEIQFVIIDVKRVTFPDLENLPHLFAPIIKDQQPAVEVLGQLVDEMEQRYLLFEEARVRDIDEYNQKAVKPLPRIVVGIDEYADLVSNEKIKPKIEESCQRLSQKARAAGIHLIIATQKPSEKVLDTVIRSNLTARVALKVETVEDSKIVLGTAGNAHHLLGMGDLIYKAGGKRQRLQGLYCPNADSYVSKLRSEAPSSSKAASNVSGKASSSSVTENAPNTPQLPPASRPTADPLLTIWEFALSKPDPVDVYQIIAADLPGVSHLHEGGVRFAFEKLAKQGYGRVEVVDERILFYPNREGDTVSTIKKHPDTTDTPVDTVIKGVSNPSSKAAQEVDGFDEKPDTYEYTAFDFARDFPEWTEEKMFARIRDTALPPGRFIKEELKFTSGERNKKARIAVGYLVRKYGDFQLIEKFKDYL